MNVLEISIASQGFASMNHTIFIVTVAAPAMFRQLMDV